MSEDKSCFPPPIPNNNEIEEKRHKNISVKNNNILPQWNNYYDNKLDIKLNKDNVLFI